MIDDDRIWKIAMWGAPRDLELIGKMQSTFAPMATFIEENRMTTAEGFKRGNRKHQCYDFNGLPLVEAKSFKPYYVSSDELQTVDFDDFECIVKNAREIFAAPHLIIKQSHKNGTFLSEVLDYDAVFNHSLLGVHGDMNKLKYLSVIIGSRVFTYYHILTNRKWLVERDELEAGDIWQTPIPKPSDEEISESCDIFDELVISPLKKQTAEKFARHMYRLKEYESYQIDDVIDYVYDYLLERIALLDSMDWPFIFSEGKAGNISLLFAVRPMINFFNYINITIISTRENLDIISDFLTYNEKSYCNESQAKY